MEAKERAGELLRNMRIEYGLSQKGVADQVNEMQTPGVTLCERHYRRIEKGEMVPSVLLAMSVCYVLDVDVYQIWG